MVHNVAGPHGVRGGLKRPCPADFGAVSQKNPNTDTNTVMPLMRAKHFTKQRDVVSMDIMCKCRKKVWKGTHQPGNGSYM